MLNEEKTLIIIKPDAIQRNFLGEVVHLDYKKEGIYYLYSEYLKK